MTTSSTSEASRQLTRSEWVSTLPPWRRLLAMLNWRPVYDIEQRTKQLRIESLESEKRLKLLKKENERLAELESRLDSLLVNADSSSQTPPATGFISRQPRERNLISRFQPSKQATSGAGIAQLGCSRSRIDFVAITPRP